MDGVHVRLNLVPLLLLSCAAFLALLEQEAAFVQGQRLNSSARSCDRPGETRRNQCTQCLSTKTDTRCQPRPLMVRANEFLASFLWQALRLYEFRTPVTFQHDMLLAHENEGKLQYSI